MTQLKDSFPGTRISCPTRLLPAAAGNWGGDNKRTRVLHPGSGETHSFSQASSKQPRVDRPVPGWGCGRRYQTNPGWGRLNPWL